MHDPRLLLLSFRKTYFSWIVYKMTHGGLRPYLAWVRRILRPTLLVRRIALFVARLLVLLESGVFFLLAASCAALLAPLVILLAVILLFRALLLRRRARAVLALSAREHPVLFLDGGGRAGNDRFLASARTYTERGYLVLLVAYPTGHGVLSPLAPSLYAISPSLYYALLRKPLDCPRCVLVAG